MRYLGVFIVIMELFFSGCYEDNKTYIDPYVKSDSYGKITAKSKEQKKLSRLQDKLKLEELKNKHQERLASIEAQKATKVKELEVQKSQIESNSKIVLSSQEQQSKIILQEKKAAFESVAFKDRNITRRLYLAVGAGLLLMLILLYIVIHSKNQKLKAKIHESELKHKEYMQESKQHHERINKTLEIIANEKTDKTLKKDLVRLLKHQGGDKPKLLS